MTIRVAKWWERLRIPISTGLGWQTAYIAGVANESRWYVSAPLFLIGAGFLALGAKWSFDDGVRVGRYAGESQPTYFRGGPLDGFPVLPPEVPFCVHGYHYESIGGRDLLCAERCDGVHTRRYAGEVR